MLKDITHTFAYTTDLDVTFALIKAVVRLVIVGRWLHKLRHVRVM
jgi:hypothetical protein